MSNLPPNYITVHASATYPDMDIGASEINSWHRARGWNGIGYHKVIRRDGTIEDGRPLGVVGAHVGGHNTYNIGICMVGGIQRGTDRPEDNFTVRQYQSLNKLITDLVGMFGEEVEIVGHNYFTDMKACPCYDWRSHVQWLRKTWRSLYLPDDWWKRDWKEGIDKDWNDVNWYKEVDVIHKDEEV